MTMNKRQVKTTKQLLIKARNLVVTGWVRGNWRTRGQHLTAHVSDTARKGKTDCYCASGAIDRAIYMNQRVKGGYRNECKRHDTKRMVRGYIDTHVAVVTSRSNLSIIGYNDMIGRTKGEVVAMMDSAIAAL